MADIQADQARFKAYEIEWISNSIGADETESSLPELFYGPNTEVTNGVSYTCKNGRHLPIGWLNGDATNVVTSVSTSSSTPGNLTTVRVGCAWIDASRTIYGTTKKPLTDATLRIYPESVSNVSFKDDDSKLPEGISLSGKVLSGTATSAGTTKVSLTAYLDETTKVEGKTTTVTFEIQEEIAKLEKDLAANLMGQEIDPVEDTFAEQDETEEMIAKGANINYPAVNELEQHVFKQEFRDKDLKERLAALEQKTFGKISSGSAVL